MGRVYRNMNTGMSVRINRVRSMDMYIIKYRKKFCWRYLRDLDSSLLSRHSNLSI